MFAKIYENLVVQPKGMMLFGECSGLFAYKKERTKGMKTKLKPIVSWSIWAFGMTIFLFGFTYKHFIKGVWEDSSHLSWLIASLFIAGFVISMKAATSLQKEWEVLDEIKATHKIPESNGHFGLCSVFTELNETKKQGKPCDINVVIDSYHARHNSQVRSVSIIAALCISMGLLGTVIGLIISIQGLGEMVNQVGVSQSGMMDKLKIVANGMGTAFYTTYYGAFFGLILRAVSVSQLNSLSELCATATEYAENNLTAKHGSKEEELEKQTLRVIESFSKMQKEVDSIAGRMISSIDASMVAFGDLLTKAGNRTVDTTEKTFTDMSNQVKMLGSEVGSAFSEFNSNVEASGTEVRASISGLSESIGSVSEAIAEISGGMNSAFADINYTIGQGGEGLTGAFGELNSSVEDAGNQMAASLSEFNGSIEESSREVETGARELRKTMQQIAQDIRALTEDKLEQEAEQIAGQLRLAAAQFNSFLKKKEAPIPQISSNDDDDSIILDDEVIL